MKALRWILWPFSVLYGSIMQVRNLLFDRGVMASSQFDLPVICIGNLSVGGTGKTPMVKYLIQQLSADYTVGVISRGYGRRSKGYYEVDLNGSASQFGDEPLEIKLACPQAHVGVCEDRVIGITKLLYDHENVNLILLDDAFQHRSVKPKVSLVLSPYSKPYFRDFVMPMGRLREFRFNIKRADAVVFTKSPKELPRRFGVFHEEYYSRVRYGDIDYRYGTSPTDCRSCLVVAGLADNGPFFREVGQRFEHVGESGFRDHKPYSEYLVSAIIKKASEFDNTIVTTAKDWVKIKPFLEKLKPDIRVGVLEIETEMDAGEAFMNWLKPKLKSDEG